MGVCLLFIHTNAKEACLLKFVFLASDRTEAVESCMHVSCSCNNSDSLGRGDCSQIFGIFVSFVLWHGTDRK